MEEAKNYYDWVYRELRPHFGGSILEIGPGYGSIARRILNDRREYYAIDTNAEVISRLQSCLPVAQEHLAVGDLSQPEWPTRFKRSGVDTLLSINVLEHVAEDERLLRSIVRCAPGGRLVIMVPAMPVLYGSFDKQAGHFRRYTRATLRALVTQSGARIRHLSYFNAVGAAAWFISARLLQMPLNSKGTNSSISFYDRSLIPLIRWADPLLRGLAGQSLIAAADIPPEAGA